MNYIGSKYRLSPWIKSEITKVVDSDLSNKVFCDLFAGTGIVGRTFKKEVKKVIANDLEEYSYVLNRNYIGNHTNLPRKKELIAELNAASLIGDGFIYTHYCLGSGSERQYFSDYNGKKIDTIRNKIRSWKHTNYINEDEFYFLLASLIESADKVANTASVYGAFLKHLKKSAQKDLVLEPANFTKNKNAHAVYKKDSNQLIKEISGDILYLDPPYNQRQYGANYHLLNTIAYYDIFEPKGKTGLREYNKSQYSQKSRVEAAFTELIEQADFKYIFLSYNNEGLMSEETVKSIMSKHGKYSLKKQAYQRFKSDKTENRNHKASSTFEYLHILIK